jgi:hypothetical protein
MGGDYPKSQYFWILFLNLSEKLRSKPAPENNRKDK